MTTIICRSCDMADVRSSFTAGKARMRRLIVRAAFRTFSTVRASRTGWTSGDTTWITTGPGGGRRCLIILVNSSGDITHAAPLPLRRRIMKLTTGSLALIVAAALSLQAFAHGKHDKKAHDKAKAQAAKSVKGEFLGKGDGVVTCPVTGEEIHNKDVKGQFFRRTVYFCCPECLAEAQKNPSAYI